MPTISDLLGNLFQGIASYQDVTLTIAVACGILLLIAGMRLVTSTQTPDKSRRRVAYGLLIGITLLALLIGVPLFIPYPHDDFLVPGVPLFPICLLVGLFAGLAFFLMRGRRPLAAVLFAVGAVALVPVVISGTSSLLGMGYSPNLIWAAYPLPPILAGAFLAWTTNTGRRYYAPYVLAWLVVVAVVVLPSYVGEMDNYQYTLDSATSWQRYQHASGAAPLINKSMQGELVVSVAYVAATLLLLVLPLLLANLPSRRRTVYTASV